MREDEFRSAIADVSLPPPHPRFGVYRRNVASSLVGALRVRYPVAAELLGDAGFAALAGEFSAAQRPASPVLIEYGGSFPEFLAVSLPRHGKPWLADVARLESLWWLAYHAAEAVPTPPAALLELSPEEMAAARFTFHPSFGLLASAFAAGTIWQARREVCGPGQFLMVARPAADVVVREVPGPGFDLALLLHRGQSLSSAAAACAARHDGFDLQEELAGLLSAEVICGVQT